MGGASSHDISGGILEPDDPQFKRKCRMLDHRGALYRVKPPFLVEGGTAQRGGVPDRQGQPGEAWLAGGLHHHPLRADLSAERAGLGTLQSRCADGFPGRGSGAMPISGVVLWALPRQCRHSKKNSRCSMSRLSTWIYKQNLQIGRTVLKQKYSIPLCLSAIFMFTKGVVCVIIKASK